MALKPSSPFWSKQKNTTGNSVYPHDQPNESAQEIAPESAAPPGNPEMSRRREPTPHGCRRGRRSPEAGSRHPMPSRYLWLVNRDPG